MDREDAFPLWAVVLGVAAGGVVAYVMASPRGKTLLRNLPQMLKDLTQQSERVLGIVRELTTEMEQSLQKVESSLDGVQQALQRETAESGSSTSFQPRAA
jgi:predicted PurR-regulated permease PerM